MPTKRAHIQVNKSALLGDLDVMGCMLSLMPGRYWCEVSLRMLHHHALRSIDDRSSSVKHATEPDFEPVAAELLAGFGHAFGNPALPIRPGLLVVPKARCPGLLQGGPGDGHGAQEGRDGDEVVAIGDISRPNPRREAPGPAQNGGNRGGPQLPGKPV